MRKSTKNYLVGALISGLILFFLIHSYGSKSEAFKYASSEIRSSKYIISHIGRIKKITLSPYGGYKEKFFNTKRQAIMTIDITGEKKSIVAKVSVIKNGGEWSTREITIDGKDIHKNEK